MSPSAFGMVLLAASLARHHAFPEQTAVQRACDWPVRQGAARCLALVRGAPGQSVPNGYGPADLQSAYNIPVSFSNTGTIVATIDAFDDPNAEADLHVYRTTYGLPDCTSANNCFIKVNQTGKRGHYPPPSSAWGLEISLDLDMISSGCPSCRILLVEASNGSQANLAEAVDEAVVLGASAISNSYVSPGTGYASYYDHPGTIITASAGDAGYGPGVPAGLPTVVAVGGTSLRRDGSPRGWSESVWSGTGSGCEPTLSKPAWQTDHGCAGRTMNDVAADADPFTPVAIYDTFGSYHGFLEGGGTSASAPFIAALYALGGNAGTLDAAQSLYARHASLYDVTTGSNGVCTPAYLCTAKRRYDGPTGNGTPNGLAAF